MEETRIITAETIDDLEYAIVMEFMSNVNLYRWKKVYSMKDKMLGIFGFKGTVGIFCDSVRNTIKETVLTSLLGIYGFVFWLLSFATYDKATEEYWCAIYFYTIGRSVGYHNDNVKLADLGHRWQKAIERSIDTSLSDTEIIEAMYDAELCKAEFERGLESGIL